MAPRSKTAVAKKSKSRVEGSTLPITLQALRERAGFTKEDGAGADLREFFAERKFSGDPDRKTAIAVVALDTILRDPSLLDATTCFGEGQIDTAVNAAALILGEDRIKKMESISGENDLEQLAEICRKAADDNDIKCGVMAARHLWGMFNTVTRSFPGEFFRNGKSDDFQAALLGVSSRHLAVFSAETMNAEADLIKMIGVAEKIAEVGGGGKYHKNPQNADQVAETFLYLCKNGRYNELHKSSLLELFGDDHQPSAKARNLCGLKEKKARKQKNTKNEEGALSWTEDPTLSGNGAFFAGRLYEEVKFRYPGYPAHSSESAYWDTCLRHPATHGICSRLYGKMGQLVRSGGVEEGISRAVTNKMVHHNTKFSRLSMLVHLSNGKSFHVHRTRPINWESHGVDSPPFAPMSVDEDGQLELGFGGSPKTATKKSGRSKGGVSVVGYELRVVNYSHMPWVNKAISQYMEEAPFIKSPKDEHQQIVSILAKELRGEGVTYRQAFDRAADIYSGLAGRGGTGVRETELLLARAWSRTGQAEELEADLASVLRDASSRKNNSLSEALNHGKKAERVREAGGGEEILQSSILELAKACDILSKYGISEEKSRELVLGLAGQYPVRIPEDGGAKVRQFMRDANLDIEIRADEASQISRMACGVASRAVKNSFSLDEQARQEMAEVLQAVIESGVVFSEDGQKIPGKAGKGDKGEIDAYLRIVEEAGAKLGISKGLAREAGEVGARVASNLIPEVERAFAERGGEVDPEVLEQIVQYAGKYADHNPLSGEEIHHRRIVGAGVDPVSLDAPMGEDQDQSLYNVVGDEKTQSGRGADYDPDEAAFEAGATSHWMDEQAGLKETSSPGFESEGGDEFFSPFSTTRIADSLYTVVSTKGTEHQLQMLKDFAGLKVEGIAGGGDGKEARKQVSAMLDMLDEQESLQGENGAMRRRFLSWVFNSVLNVAGVDGSGYDKMGGIGSTTLRKGLFDKIRRYGMPGIVVVENAEMDKADELLGGIRNAKAWGFTSIGVCLPKTAESEVREWSSEGGAGRLVKLLSRLTDGRHTLEKALKSGELGNTANEAVASILNGKSDADSDQSFNFLQATPDCEKQLLKSLKITAPELHQKLVIGKLAATGDLELNCLGDGSNEEEIADRAKMDSLIFTDRENGSTIGEAIAGFGIKARVVKGNPEQALHGHADYATAVVLKDGSLDKGKLIEATKIPLSRKLLLAAQVAQEALEKGSHRGGY